MLIKFSVTCLHGRNCELMLHGQTMARNKQVGISQIPSLDPDLNRRSNNYKQECNDLPNVAQSINSVPSTDRLQAELGLSKHVDWFIWSESGG